jgi:class 3 adenylate cyclase
LDSSADAVNRRLAAILAADATNYSGLVAEDEESTLRALAIHRAGIDEAIANHSGRIFATAGDSVLAEFSSPVQAVRAAIEMQRVLEQAKARCALRAPMLFRIGVNVGDVVVDGDNILGDGVNLAARLENHAPPGGICVSANVRDHVLGKVDCRFQDLGTQFLKNIPRPVRAFQVVADASGEASLRERLRKYSPRAAIGSAAVALLVSIGTWHVAQQRHLQDAASAQPTPPPASAGKLEEVVYWESIKQTADPDELRNYLAKYPGGAFAALAQTRLEGILIGRSRAAEDEAAAAKREQAEQAQREAKRLKQEADAAIARAASEQSVVTRLRAEADQAASRAAAAANAADEAHQKLLRTQGAYASVGAERVTLLRTASPLDGRWTGELSCNASADQPMSSTYLPVQIQFREIRIETGQVGLPGYLRAYGSVTEDGSFQLQGISLPRTQRIVGTEDSIKVNGRAIDHNRLEANGTVGERRCSLAFIRLAGQ